jgi:uncharacterized phage-associated protein
VLDAYGRESTYALQIRTHHEGPWLEARRSAALEGNAVISQDSMRRFFNKRADNSEDHSQALAIIHA